jgi:hypothetical protein
MGLLWASLIQIHSKRFWRWCIILRTNCLLDFVHRPDKILKYYIKITTSFRNVVIFILYFNILSGRWTKYRRQLVLNSLIQFTVFTRPGFKILLIFSPHLHLSSKWSVPSGFWQILCKHLTVPVRPACVAHLIFLDLITRVGRAEDINKPRSYIYIYIHIYTHCRLWKASLDLYSCKLNVCQFKRVISSSY